MIPLINGHRVQACFDFSKFYIARYQLAELKIELTLMDVF